MCEWITSNKVSFSNQKHVYEWKNQYLQDDEEFISGLSLHYNLLSVLELDGLQGISHRQTLPFVKRLWGDRYGRTELRWWTSQRIICFWKVEAFIVSCWIFLNALSGYFNLITKPKEDASLSLSRKTWKHMNTPKMDTFLRNSSYIFLFLKVLP